MKSITLFSLFMLCLGFFSGSCAAPRAEIRPLPRILAGSSKGLYTWDGRSEAAMLWGQGSVSKILCRENDYFFLTDKGILYSSNLIHFELRNQGIRTWTIKTYDQGVKKLEDRLPEVKDLNWDPLHREWLVCATRDGIYISTNRGLLWFFKSRPSAIPGIKTVAVSAVHKKVYLGHPFRGIYTLDWPLPSDWRSLSSGLAENFGGPEEISDILCTTPRILSANNFTPRVYQLHGMKWQTLLLTNHLTGHMLESMSLLSNQLIFVSEKGVFIKNLDRPEDASLPYDAVNLLIQDWDMSRYGRLNSLGWPDGPAGWSLDHLWMCREPWYDQQTQQALGIRALYLPAGMLRNKNSRDKIISLMKETGQNGIVVDMKDDSGILRFNPANAELSKMAKIRSPLDLKEITVQLKKQGIYLIARMVVFKDHHLYQYQQNAYAVMDRISKKPWQGIKIDAQGRETNRIAEYWVDPFCEKVWEYNVDIARDLVEQGFDEIQFDYIRFPTDGVNISRAWYAWQEGHMDKSSALESFLKYAREHIQAPISIDIYGGNGWNRSGTHTGQDVEMIRHYVNAICPMFYPSHFPQDFLSDKPAQLRPWRIYYYGTFRNWMIAHKQVTIRPYVQAFRLNVSYDRQFYGPDYIFQELRGTEDALGEGYIFWNAAGEYSILRKTLSLFTNR